MKHIRLGFYFGVLVLMLLSACQMGTATPTASVTCKQTGCPYPAVCDKNSGVCTIYQTPQAPLTKANNAGPAAGAIAANNPNAGSILPAACNPPVPSIDQVTAFCANSSANIGGASFVFHPGQPLPNPGLQTGYAGWAWTEETGLCNWTDGNAGTKDICTGKPGTNIQVMVCTQCTLFSSLPSPKDVTCPNGSVMETPGFPLNGCANVGPTPNPNVPYVWLCPTGSHYDNTKQSCVDNVSGDSVAGMESSLCPTGYPYFDMGTGLCSKVPLHQYNCQYFSVPLGVCLTPKQIPNGKKCIINPLTGAC